LENINCGIEQNAEIKIFAEFLLKIGISKFAELSKKRKILKKGNYKLKKTTFANTVYEKLLHLAKIKTCCFFANF